MAAISGAVLAAIALFSSLTGCGTGGSGNLSLNLSGASQVDAASVSVVTLEQSGLTVYDMGDYLPEDAAYLGYDPDGGAIVYALGTEIREVTVEDRTDSFALELDLDTEKESLDDIFYSDGWLVWVQSVIGDEDGAWQLRAADIRTGETVTADEGEDHAAPVSVVCREGYIAYTAFDGSRYRAVKLYDLDEREQVVIARSPVEDGWHFTSPSIGHGFVVYDAADREGKYSIVCYDLETEETFELLTGAELTCSAACGDYIATAVTVDGVSTLAVYDAVNAEWRAAVNASTSIALGESFNQFHSLSSWESYLGWGNYASYPGVYVYDIATNTAYELMSAGSDTRFVSTLPLTSPLYAWREYDSENNQTAFRFVIFDQK